MTSKTFKLRNYQVELAKRGYALLKQYGFAYNISQERVGKTASTLYLIELTIRQKCLFLTKKAAVPDIQDTITKMTEAGLLNKHVVVTNYESVHKLDPTFKPDIAILDEAHHALSGYPKPGKILQLVHSIVYGLPIVYMSATPHSETYSQIYHQLVLSKWSPFRDRNNFYDWHREYGIPKTTYLGRRAIPNYKVTQEERLKKLLDPYFYGMTREEAGFTEEAEDKKHYITLTPTTVEYLRQVNKDKVLRIGGYESMIESVGAEMQKNYQLEGGTVKIQTGVEFTGRTVMEEGVAVKQTRPVYVNLFTGTTEKIDHIKEVWGDSPDVVIMYNYINEGLLLNQHFSKALILQADRFAEGISLKDKKHLIIYSMSWRTSKYIQRRNRQADLTRKTPIIVHYLLVKDNISEYIYDCVAVKQSNFTERIYGIMKKGRQ